MKNQQLQHLAMEHDADGIAWLHLNQAGAAVNTLSRELMEELESVVGDLGSANPPKGLVILSDKKGFLAGADVREFSQLQESDAALTLIRRGQALMERIEALPFPTLALIRGHCLGGGLELALACRYRIAENSPATRIGLPEVRLGIHPGFGGTVRLTRLLGPGAAMELMLSGKNLDARGARKLGLIHRALPERQLRRAATRLLLEPPALRRPSALHALANHRWVRPALAQLMRRQLAKKVAPAHYPAPYALIDLWKNHGDNPAAMLEAEGQSVAQLITGKPARNLLRTFFLQERLKSLSHECSEVRHVHVIGAGRMGGDIAAWCALQGLRVTLQDREPQLIGPAMARAHALFRKRLREPHLVTAAMDRLMPDNRGIGIANAELILEAVVEDVAVKQELLRDIEPRLREDALLASNTSSIPLETLAEALERPERLVGLHFFNPVARMPLVEVVRGAASSDAALTRATAFVRSIDRLPLPVKSAPGFLVNRILMPYLLEAMRLAEEGFPAAEIDKAATDFGMPMGPLRLADSVGLDVCLSVARILIPGDGTAGHGTIPERLEALVRSGQLGQKSGEGFYRYRRGNAISQTPPLRALLTKAGAQPEGIADRLLFSMLRECLDCLRDGIVADADLLDAGMLFGTGFPPFQGGPMHYLHQEDPSVLQRRFEALAQQHGERFAPIDWGQATGLAAG